MRAGHAGRPGRRHGLVGGAGVSVAGGPIERHGGSLAGWRHQTRCAEGTDGYRRIRPAAPPQRLCVPDRDVAGVGGYDQIVAGGRRVRSADGHAPRQPTGISGAGLGEHRFRVVRWTATGADECPRRAFDQRQCARPRYPDRRGTGHCAAVRRRQRLGGAAAPRGAGRHHDDHCNLAGRPVVAPSVRSVAGRRAVARPALEPFHRGDRLRVHAGVRSPLRSSPAHFWRCSCSCSA